MKSITKSKKIAKFELLLRGKEDKKDAKPRSEQILTKKERERENDDDGDDDDEDNQDACT